MEAMLKPRSRDKNARLDMSLRACLSGHVDARAGRLVAGAWPGGQGHLARRTGLGLLAALAATLACEATPVIDRGEPAPASAPAEPTPAPAEPAQVHPILPWLDPDASSALYSKLDPGLDLEALARLFAVPPRAGHMLRDLQAFDGGLAALMEGVGPAPATWLRREALAFLPPLARGPYLVRGLARPRAEVEAALTAGGLVREVLEGLTTYSPLPAGDAPPGPADALPVHHAPAAAFPWRIVFLEDDVIGCYSLKEMGNGLGPLTAARDLPASELETQLTREFAEDPEMLFDLVAGGPMLSLDITEDVGAIRLGIRRWERTGIDGELILQPLGEPDAAVKQLEARKPALETDAVRELYERIAFTPEPPVVRGRLQLTEADVRLLGEAR